MNPGASSWNIDTCGKGLDIGPNGQVTRVPSPRFYARQQVGRISFGAQDVESSPANESAIGAGLRTSGEVLPLL